MKYIVTEQAGEQYFEHVNFWSANDKSPSLLNIGSRLPVGTEVDESEVDIVWQYRHTEYSEWLNSTADKDIYKNGFADYKEDNCEILTRHVATIKENSNYPDFEGIKNNMPEAGKKEWSDKAYFDKYQASSPVPHYPVFSEDGSNTEEEKELFLFID